MMDEYNISVDNHFRLLIASDKDNKSLSCEVRGFCIGSIQSARLMLFNLSFNLDDGLRLFGGDEIS